MLVMKKRARLQIKAFKFHQKPVNIFLTNTGNAGKN
jgi:hypothetical protein